MTKFEKGIIDLVKSSVTDYKTTLPIGFDWEKAYKVALQHKIIPMLYCGAVNSNVTMPNNISKQLELMFYKSISVSTIQDYELNRICNSFRKNGIDFMTLKGAVIKKFYPKSELRQMNDVDILVKTEQYGLIAPIMTKLGFTEIIESDHEYIWGKNKEFKIELHKRLIPSYNKDYYAYYGEGWQFARNVEGNEYALSKEDTFVYIFTHFAKHYRDGGIGIRHMTDFFIYLSANPNMDMEYIEYELTKLKLLEFYKNIMKTLSVWFENGKPDKITDFITSRFFENGPNGTYYSQVVAGATRSIASAKNNAEMRLKRTLHLFFLPYRVMKKRYPVLKKAPILLPILWVVRLINIICNKQDEIKKYRNSLKLMTSENISEYKKELNFVGLDFNFEE